MPRQARQASGTGIYHVMMRGINHQNRRTSERRAKLAWAIPSEKEEDEVNIFEEQEDYYQFLNTLDIRIRGTGTFIHSLYTNKHNTFPQELLSKCSLNWELLSIPYKYHASECQKGKRLWHLPCDDARGKSSGYLRRWWGLPAVYGYSCGLAVPAWWWREAAAHTYENQNDNDNDGSFRSKSEKNPIENLPKDWEKMSDQEIAVWYNDHVIYPDKVRLNCYYYRHYSFIKDIQMIFCTVLGRKMEYAGEII